MTVAFTAKQPYESYAVSFDFTSDLGAETIASIAVTAVDTATLADVSTSILDSTRQTNTDTLVYPCVQGGTSDHSYLITCKIVGSAGSKYELEAILPVAETPADTDEEGIGENLASLITAIQGVIQDETTYTDPILAVRINDAVSAIAGGIRMPDQSTSPPLPELYANSTVNTTALAYASLPSNYQRKVFNVVDSSGCKIAPPRGGDYYAFSLFMKQINNMNLTETGSVYRVCVKGRKLYYQGIPAIATNIGVHYYRKPVAMAADADEPDGIPEHLQLRLIKHYVCKEIYGEAIEDGQDNSGIGTKYHTSKFYEAMMDLVDFIGIDAEPQYYGDDDFQDAGACD